MAVLFENFYIADINSELIDAEKGIRSVCCDSRLLITSDLELTHSLALSFQKSLESVVFTRKTFNGLVRVLFENFAFKDLVCRWTHFIIL